MKKLFLYVIPILVFVFLPYFYLKETLDFIKMNIGIRDFEVLLYFTLFYSIHLIITYQFIHAKKIKRLLLSIFVLFITELTFLMIASALSHFKIDGTLYHHFGLHKLICLIFAIREILLIINTESFLLLGRKYLKLEM